MTPPSETNSVEAIPIRSTSQKKRTRKKLNGIKEKKTTPPPRPRKSLIRKRPVIFGNPALGTYNGCLYTLDVAGEDYSPINRPIVEGAESVDRVVAMVDVPPDQVPEGILNLARSHRPFLHHVRIVVAENPEDFKVEPVHQPSEDLMGQEETKDDAGIPSQTTSLSTVAVEEAASIMAADEELQSIQNIDSSAKHEDANTSNEGDVFNLPSRTYVVLMELCSGDAAEAFVDDLHEKPYTSLDTTQTCSVHQVLALTGENGVSLLSPFFAPTAKTASPKAGVAGAIISVTASKSIASGAKPINNVAVETLTVTTSQQTPIIATPTPPAPIVEDYNCAVCLEPLNDVAVENDDNDTTKSRSSILTTVCNHSFHLDCLLKWQDSPCPVCRYDHSGLNEALSQCHICGRTENNYVCLICGVVSCGGPPVRVSNGIPSEVASQDRMHSQSPVCGSSNTSPVGVSNPSLDQNGANNGISPVESPHTLSQSHARKHYDQTLHAYALDTETQHVWDFAGQGYVHRLLQNKEDGKLVEFHNPSNTSSHERSQQPGLSDTQEGEVVHRKLEGYASQYYTLLKSQLEQQRIFYEGRLEELRRESLVRKKAQTSDLISALKQEKAQLSKRVATLKTRHCKIVEDAAFLRNMNESLEANKGPLKHRVKEAQRLRIEARDQIQQCLPVLEEKVAVLLQELTGETYNNDEGVVSHNPTAQDGDDTVCEDLKPAAQS